ncbi:MAG: 16S rRNA (cytidine(1402)-2'-O)-methyltransferase [Alphaproteobacteria bacterium]|nr:16S rRNA (cytidine(1402)-2'-O)-methyltransferase [Alphaproteobacteria bacterium]
MTSNAKSVKKQKTSPDYSAWAGQVLKASEDGQASKEAALAPGLYIVATPIGNLGDITLRALWTLREADVVICEDTRVTGGLLHRYGLKKPLLSYHDHNAEERQPEILARLAQGQKVALVSDAGTPLISDPGYKMVQACRAAAFSVVAVPGASAALTALTVAGLPTDKFLFVGFLPPKQTARRKALEDFNAVSATLVFYEAPARLGAMLADLRDILGAERPAAVARELTKLFEEVKTQSLTELAAAYAEEKETKGEIVGLVRVGGYSVLR